MRAQARLILTELDYVIRQEENPEFFHLLQIAILLALKESNILTEEQFQFASMQLDNQEYGGDQNDAGGILLPGIHRPG